MRDEKKLKDDDLCINFVVVRFYLFFHVAGKRMKINKLDLSSKNQMADMAETVCEYKSLATTVKKCRKNCCRLGKST